MRYYLQLRHSRVPFSALPFAINDAGLITLRQNEHMRLGIYFRLAILAVALANANAVAYRDSGFAAYAVHVAALSGAQVSLTGLASLYLWPQLPQLNNASAIFLASLSAASALLFVCIIGELQRLAPRLDALMKALILALLACGIANALMLSAAFVASVGPSIAGGDECGTATPAAVCRADDQPGQPGHSASRAWPRCR